jgi:hypothetical protein
MKVIGSAHEICACRSDRADADATYFQRIAPAMEAKDAAAAADPQDEASLHDLEADGPRVCVRRRGRGE